MTSRPLRATGSARSRPTGSSRSRATALALALSFSPLAALPVLAPAVLAQQSTFVPGPDVVLPDSDRAAAIREERRQGPQDHGTTAEGGGMPQLDFNNPLTISQVVWLLVIFGLFVYLCANYLLPPVTAVLTESRERIGADLDAARAAKSEADGAADAHRAATERARAEATAAIAGAVQSANAEAGAKAAVLNARLNEQVAAAEERIARARAAAMGALREVSVDATGALVERLAGIRDPAAVTAAVDRALATRTVAAGGRT